MFGFGDLQRGEKTNYNKKKGKKEQYAMRNRFFALGFLVVAGEPNLHRSSKRDIRAILHRALDFFFFQFCFFSRAGYVLLFIHQTRACARFIYLLFFSFFLEKLEITILDATAIDFFYSCSFDAR